MLNWVLKKERITLENLNSGSRAAHGMLKFKCGMTVPPPCLALKAILVADCPIKLGLLESVPAQVTDSGRMNFQLFLGVQQAAKVKRPFSFTMGIGVAKLRTF